MPTVSAMFRRPFKEQVAYFRQKQSLPTNRWDDLWRDEHDKAFVVAGATKADLLADLRAVVDDAITNGQSLGAFRQQFREIVAKRGWTGWTGEGTKAGTAWRTRVIYKTNMDTSYMAGRWQQMTDPDVVRARPYWRYVHNTVENPRIQHQRWDGLMLPAGDPWFHTHWPPNGWGCNCGVETMSRRQLERSGRTGPDTAPSDGTAEHVNDRTGDLTEVPKGVQPGWDYAPGKSAAETAIAARLNRLDTLEANVARLNVKDLVDSDLFTRFFAGEVKGEFPIAVVPPVEREILGAESPTLLLSQASLATHIERHPEIGLADYRRVQELLDQGEVYRREGDDGRLIYLTVEGVTYRAALKRTQDGKRNYFLTLFKVKESAAERNVRNKMERLR